MPDLAIFQNDTIVEQDGYIHSAPQLAVEVLSPSNTRPKVEEKLVDYASIGVPEAWIFLPETKAVEVFYLEAGRLRCVRVLKGEGTLMPKHFPTVTVDIVKVWPE